MTDRKALIHDLEIIGHLSEKLDTGDQKQVAAVLLMQKNSGLMVTAYGKRFIAVLIDIFRDNHPENTCIFTGEKLEDGFPVSAKMLDLIKSDPGNAANLIIKREKASEKADDESDNSPKAIHELSDADDRGRAIMLLVLAAAAFIVLGLWNIFIKSPGVLPVEIILGAGTVPAVLAFYINDRFNGNDRHLVDTRTNMICAAAGFILSMVLTEVTSLLFANGIALHLILSALIDTASVAVLMFLFTMVSRNKRQITMADGICRGTILGSTFSFYSICDMVLKEYVHDGRAGILMFRLAGESILSAGGRVAWSAVAGGATAVLLNRDIVKEKELKLRMILASFIFPLIMQICWNAGFLNRGLYGVSLKNVFLAVIGIEVLRVFVQLSSVPDSERKTDV